MLKTLRKLLQPLNICALDCSLCPNSAIKIATLKLRPAKEDFEGMLAATRRAEVRKPPGCTHFEPERGYIRMYTRLWRCYITARISKLAAGC